MRFFNSDRGQPWPSLVVGGIMMILVLGSCAHEEAVADQEDPGISLELAGINEAIRKTPNDPEGYVLRAQYHSSVGNHGDAIDDMAHAMSLDSVNAGYHHVLADIYLRATRSQLAIATMERAAMLFPDSVNTLLKLAEMHLIVRQYDRTSSVLRQILTRAPQNTDALHLLGLMYREQGEIERAIQSFRTIVEIDSEDAEAWTMLGNMLDEMGDPTALQCFENAIDIDPAYPQAWHSKAFYLQNRDRIPEAIEIYKHIHEIDSGYTDAWLNRGILYLELDSLVDAKECFSTLVAIDSTSVMGNYYAGKAAQLAGDKSSAKAFFMQALELSPSSGFIIESIESLGE